MKEFVACNANSNNGKMFTPDEWISIELIVCKNTITNEDRNIWRKEFRPSDPPAQTPPFTIKLKPNAIPYIAKARKYNDEEIRFLIYGTKNSLMVDWLFTITNQDGPVEFYPSKNEQMTFWWKYPVQMEKYQKLSNLMKPS